MRALTNARTMLVGLVFLAAAAIAGCGLTQPPNSAGPGNGSATTPEATAAATTPGTSPAASGGVQDLVISSAAKSELTTAYLAFRGGISLSDVAGAGPMPGSVYYAYDPTTDTHWALADFEPSSTASLDVQVGFQDGGGRAMFRKTGAGAWQVGTPGVPYFCGEVKFFPQPVLIAWSMPTTAPPGLTC
jgi:hypothetical protein